MIADSRVCGVRTELLCMIVWIGPTSIAVTLMSRWYGCMAMVDDRADQWGLGVMVMVSMRVIRRVVVQNHRMIHGDGWMLRCGRITVYGRSRGCHGRHTLIIIIPSMHCQGSWGHIETREPIWLADHATIIVPEWKRGLIMIKKAKLVHHGLVIPIQSDARL